MSLNHLAARFACTWPWTTAVMLCDGRIVCGCADPYGTRILGDARRESLGAIWNGPTIRALRGDLNAGGSTFCGDCPLKLPLDERDAPPQRPVDAGPLPARLYVECTAACNISCFQACCAPETGITRTRQAGMLDYDLFTRVIDEAGAALGRVDFFNYGEAFLHKRAVDMCAYIKSRFPHIYLYTSTNGLAFRGDAARRLVHTGIDEVTFSIDGASQETYARYRQRGQFDIAVTALREMAEEKRRAGRDVPVLNWRYILFAWNDSDEVRVVLIFDVWNPLLRDGALSLYVRGSPMNEKCRHAGANGHDEEANNETDNSTSGGHYSGLRCTAWSVCLVSLKRHSAGTVTCAAIPEFRSALLNRFPRYP